MKYSVAITYRCDDDQIIVVQNFGNDTIRMHCQKPILCGFQFLKCHYNHLQSHCGGKTNFVAHLQQLTPISPVMHTCCNLTINEDIEITAHTGNDCFLYDIPDGSNGTTAKDLEKEDKEGYMLLKNVNKLPEKFVDFSGYRLRYYLLRKKESTQFVIKGLERNKVGYRITICSIQCQDSSEKLKPIIYNDDDKHRDLNKKEQIISNDNLNQIKIALRNLTDDGQWMIATWAEWTYKQWSQWSILHKIELNGLDGTRGRDRYRIHEADTEIKTATETGQGKDIKMFTEKSKKGHYRVRGRSRNCNDYEDYSTEIAKSNVAKEEPKLKVQSKDCDDNEDYTAKMDKSSITKEVPKLKVRSKDCDDNEDYTAKMDKSSIAKEEQKLKKHSEKIASSDNKKELIIKLSEKRNCSELGTLENLKSELKSHETNETKKETNLLATSVTHAKEAENQTKKDVNLLVTSVTQAEEIENAKKKETDLLVTSVTQAEEIENAKKKETDLLVTSVTQAEEIENAKKKETDLLVTSVTQAEEIENAKKKETDLLVTSVTQAEEIENAKKKETDLLVTSVTQAEEIENAKKKETDLLVTSVTQAEEIESAKKKETDLLVTSVTQAEEIGNQKKYDAKKTESYDESNIMIQRSRPCDILIAIKIGNCGGEVNVVNTTKMTEDKEKDISEIKHRDINLRISPESYSSGKQLLEEKKSDNKKEEDVKRQQIESSSAKSKIYSKKLSRNETITITHENSTSQAIKKETISKQKIFGEKSASQGRKKKQPKKKAKDKSKQTSELENRTLLSTAANVRKSKIVHDPVQAVLGVAKGPVAKAQLANPAMNCFSADTKVYTHNGEKIMKDVVVGDFVLVPVSKNQLRYERVEMFYHREPETRAKFVTLETESGRNLKLTELHLLPLGDCKQMSESSIDADSIDQWLRKSKFAYKARVGDCVFTMTTNHKLQVDRIIKVGRQYLKGIYSPMTVEGSIVVNGVLASCFSQVENHFTQKLVYDFLIFLHRMFGWLMQSLDEPIQHLPTFIHSIHHLGRFAVPFVKY